MKKYLLLFVIAAIGVSLFFVKFNFYTPKEGDSAEETSYVFKTFDKETDARTYVDVLQKKGLSFPVKIGKGKTGFGILFVYDGENDKDAKLDAIHKLSLAPVPVPVAVTIEKYVVITYDHKANAQSFVQYLVNKNLSFPLKVEKAKTGVDVFFEFRGEVDRAAKLEELKKITGMTY